MGFFQDLKEDLSQAVNELMPEEDMELENVAEASEETEPAAETAVTNEDAETAVMNEDADEDAELRLLEEQLKALEEAENARLAGKSEQDAVEELEEIEEVSEVYEDMDEKDEPVQMVSDKEHDMKKEQTTEKEGDKKMAEQTTKLTGVATDETSVITAGMTITGNISSKGSIDIIGSIIGDVETLGKLDVTGSIKGNSKAAEVYAESARINGEIRSEGSIKIGQNSVIIGNVFAKSAVIAGAVKGDIDVQGAVILDTTAIVMGNIKSKSVQINNGAVIEGLCSQCYADKNPTSFFEDYK